MDFGQVRVVPRIIPELPALRDTLPRRESRGLELILGLPIWSTAKWTGEFYPRGTRAADALREYARRVASIELNSSFYRVPELSTASRWAASTPAHFRFITKFPKDLSQDAVLRIDQLHVLQHALDAFRALGDRWGGGFLQLPPSFAPSSLGLLSRWLTAFRRLEPQAPFALEFRHLAWFMDRQLIPEAAELLTHHRVATVITDTLGIPAVSHGTLTAPWVMVRFLGHGGDASDAVRLKRWTRRIEQWRVAGVERAYFFIHQSEEPWMPRTLREFTQLLESLELLPPTFDQLVQGTQISLF